MPMNRSDRADIPYFPYIDGIRALSIVAVVLFHLDERLLPGGFGGVDIFFVVSGFVVSGSLHGLRFGRFREFAAFFYARRARRILPALALMLLVVSVVTVLFTPRAYFSFQLREAALAAFFGFSNVVLALAGNDYFAEPAALNPFTHTWSLGVEEQFYLAFPLFYLALSEFKHVRRYATVGLVALSVGSLAYALSQVHGNPVFNFYMIFGRFWELGLGVGFYMVLAIKDRFLPRDGASDELKFATYAGIALVVAGFVAGNPATYPFPGALLPAAGSILLLVGLHGRAPSSPVAAILVAKPVLWIGRLSYSLYLWHWPVFALSRWTTGLESPAEKGMALLLVLALSVGSYRLVEQPFRRAQLFRKPRLAIAASLGLLVFCALLSKAVLQNRAELSISTVMRHRADWFVDVDTGKPDANGCTIRLQNKQLAKGNVRIIERNLCAAPQVKRSLFVIGDSHALAFERLLGDFSRQTGARIFLYSNGGCAFIGFTSIAPRCEQVTAAALDDIRKNAQPGDVLFMPSLRLLRFRDQWQSGVRDAVTLMSNPIYGEYRNRDIEAGTVVLREFSEKGIKLLFELPLPIFRTPLFRCSDWFNAGNPVCSDGMIMDRDYLMDYRAPVIAAIQTIEKNVPSVRSWDPFPIVCPENPCRMMRDGKPLYFDTDHLSGYGNRVLLPSFSSTVKELWGDGS